MANDVFCVCCDYLRWLLPVAAEACFRRGAPKVLTLIAQGRSYRLVGREVGLSKNTVAEIVKRHRGTPEG